MSSAPQPWIIANWKMNLDGAACDRLATAVASSEVAAAVHLVLAPPYPYMERVARILAGSAVGLAGQDLHPEPAGAFTGSVSGGMLRDVGAASVLVGHSERRCLMGETDELVRAKAGAAVAAGLRPVVCVGEDLAQREAGRADEVVTRQVSAVLEDEAWAGAEGLMVAYEPVWAIGTGRVAEPGQVARIHATIRKCLPSEASILYGGSVNRENAARLMAEAEIDGLLVGSASLSSESFLSLAREAAGAC